MGKKRVIEKASETSDKIGDTKSPVVGVKTSRRIEYGIAHIQATYNNTIISITDEKGNVLAWSSAGSLGFSGAKKATPFVAARIAQTTVEKSAKFGLHSVAVRVSGVGSGRDSAVRALANHGLNIVSIKDVTPIPHNGPRPKKARRV